MRGGPVLLVLAILISFSVFRSLCQLVGEMPWLLPLLATATSGPELMPAARRFVASGQAASLSRTATVSALGAARSVRNSLAAALEHKRQVS